MVLGTISLILTCIALGYDLSAGTGLVLGKYLRPFKAIRTVDFDAE